MPTQPKLTEDGFWEGLPDQTTPTDEWTVLVLDNGFRILSFGLNYQAGDMVHVIDPSGREIGTWSQEEWAEEPESVMGAFLRAAAGIPID